jgi:TolA-binding protein
MKVCLRIGLLAGVSAVLLSADASYTEVTKFTGGTAVEMAKKMANMPLIGRMGGGAMKSAFEDQHHDVYVKGNKMARLGGMISTIYDLDGGTITTINNTKQTYTTMTFDEMREQIEQMQQRMNRRRGGGGDLQFDVKVEKTGQTRTIDGQSAKETLITMTAKGESANGQMVVKTHAWLVPLSDATRELVDFTRKLGEKFAYAYGSSPMMGAAAGGLGAAMKEAFSQDGYPVETDVEVSGLTTAGPMGGGGDPSAPFLQMETQSSNFATGVVDAGKFSVPAGYKEEKRRH